MGKPTPGRRATLPPGGRAGPAAPACPVRGSGLPSGRGPAHLPTPGVRTEICAGEAVGAPRVPPGEPSHGPPRVPRPPPAPGWARLRPRGFGERPLCGNAAAPCRETARSFTLELHPNSSLFQSRRPPRQRSRSGLTARRGGGGGSSGRGRGCPPQACSAMPPARGRTPSTRFLFCGPLVPLGAHSCLLRSRARGVGRAQIRLSALALAPSSGKKGDVSKPHADRRRCTPCLRRWSPGLQASNTRSGLSATWRVPRNDRPTRTSFPLPAREPRTRSRKPGSRTALVLLGIEEEPQGCCPKQGGARGPPSQAAGPVIDFVPPHMQSMSPHTFTMGRRGPKPRGQHDHFT